MKDESHESHKAMKDVVYTTICMHLYNTIPGFWIYKILIQGFTKQTMFWVF